MNQEIETDWKSLFDYREKRSACLGVSTIPPPHENNLPIMNIKSDRSRPSPYPNAQSKKLSSSQNNRCTNIDAKAQGDGVPFRLIFSKYAMKSAGVARYAL